MVRQAAWSPPPPKGVGACVWTTKLVVYQFLLFHLRLIFASCILKRPFGYYTILVQRTEVRLGGLAQLGFTVCGVSLLKHGN